MMLYVPIRSNNGNLPFLFSDFIYYCQNYFVLQGQLGRIAAIYIPFLGIILDNLNRLNAVQEASGKHTELHHMYSSSSRFSNSSSFLNLKDSGTSVGTPKSLNRFTMHLDGNSSARASTHFRDSSYFAAIAGQGKIVYTLP